MNFMIAFDVYLFIILAFLWVIVQGYRLNELAFGRTQAGTFVALVFSVIILNILWLFPVYIIPPLNNLLGI